MGKPKTAASLLYPIDMYVNWDETSKRWNMDLEQASVPACSVSVSVSTINKIASQNSEGRLEENTRAGL